MSDGSGPRLWVLVGLALVLWTGEYIRRGLWEPDEARYAYVAREMRTSGHWIVPHLHGEPYPDKPPLPFWLTNLAASALGGSIDGVTARLPTFVAAIVVLWTTARLLARWGGGAAAWRGVGILSTAYLFWHEGGWGRLDLLLLAAEMGALYHLFTYNDRPQPWRIAAAAACLAVAVLTKGPVGLAVPLAVYAAATWAGGGSRGLRPGHWLQLIALAVLPAALWLLAAWRAGAPASYFEAMLGAKSFGRVVRDHHAQPFYYYATTFPLDFLPWTVFLPAATRALGPGPARRRLLAWGGVVLALFSLSVGKRNTYVLLAFPAAAMLIALGWDGVARLSARWRRGTVAGALTLVLLVAAVQAVAAFMPDSPLPRAPVAAGALLMFGGAARLLALGRREPLGDRWLATFCTLFVLQWTLLGTAVIPALNSRKAPLAVAAAAAQSLPAGEPVHLYREQLAIVPLYADRPGRLLRTPSEVEALLRSARPFLIVFSAADWESLSPPIRDRLEGHPFEMGSKDLVWARRR